MSEHALPSPEHPLHGSCLCGGVRYAVSGPFLRANDCHCSRCRKHSGAAALPQGRVQIEAFSLLAGEDLLRVFRPADGMAKVFCSVCGSSLFGGTWPDGPEVSIRLGTLDGDPGIRPLFHSYVDSKAVWDELPDDGLPRFPGAPQRMPSDRAASAPPSGHVEVDGVAVLRKLFDSGARGDYAAAMSCYADDVVLEVGEIGTTGGFLGQGSFSGVEAVGKWFGDWFGNFERGSYEFELRETVAFGGGVYLHARHRARGRRSGAISEMDAFYAAAVRGGRITQFAIVGDRVGALELARSFGANDPPGEL